LKDLLNADSHSPPLFSASRVLAGINYERHVWVRKRTGFGPPFYYPNNAFFFEKKARGELKK
jgi:hypothetical protein